MSEEHMNMSLDALIKAKPSLVKRDRRGRGSKPGGGGGNRGKSRGGGGGGGNGSGRRRSRGGGAGNSRPTPYSRGGRTSGGGGGGPAKLIISNLEYSVNDQDIRELFSEFGAIRTHSVHYDRSGRSLGTADVVYLNRSAALQAIKTYNNVPLDGKPMLVELVTDKPNSAGPPASRLGGGGGGSRGRGRGGRRGGRGGGSRGPKKTPMTAEELDKQLDDYKNKA